MSYEGVITVGITSRFASPSLVATCRSIREARGFEQGRIILVNDHTPLSNKQKTELSGLGVEIYENETEQSIQGKMKQILEMTRTPYVFLTQDDIRFDSNIFIDINDYLQNNKITLAAVKNIPLPAHNLTGMCLVSGVHFTNEIISNWNKGDCYLACIGRALLIDSDWFNKFYVDPTVVGLDAHMYFENKKQGYRFANINEGKIYFRCPEKFSEHRRKSSRFQYLPEELKRLQRYQDLDQQLQIPRLVFLKSFIKTLFSEPIWFTGYLFILSLTRFSPMKQNNVLTQFWDAAVSTQII